MGQKMIHVDEGTLQAWLDGALSSKDRAAVEVHLADCMVCEGQVAELRALDARAGEAFSLIAETRPADLPTLAAVHRRRRSGGIARVLPAGLARAAVLLLALAGVVAAALPDSPVRRWLEEVLDPPAAVPPAPQVTAPATPAAPLVPPVQLTGRELPLADGSIEIRLISPAPGLEFRVEMVESRLVSVTWNADDPDVRSTSATGRLEVAELSRGPVTILIPRVASRASILVDGQVWWTKTGTETRIVGPGQEGADHAVTFSARN